MTILDVIKVIPVLCKVVRWFSWKKPSVALCLIVEDNQYDAELLQHKLERQGYECEIAESGEVAEGLVRHKNYDLCFIDLRLPGMSGAALLRVLSTTAPHSHHIIVCGEISDMQEVPAGRFVCLIKKPATWEAIADMAHKLKPIGRKKR